MDNWYALFVLTGEEDKVKQRLNYRLDNNQIRAIVPKRKLRERKNGVWEDKVRVLFPGYVLMNGIIEVNNYYELKEIPGILSILRDKNGPLIIDPNEISYIIRLLSEGEVIEVSNGYLEGSKIVIIDGPLIGLEGLIMSVNKRKGRVKVRMNLIGEARVVDLSVNIVKKC